MECMLALATKISTCRSQTFATYVVNLVFIFVTSLVKLLSAPLNIRAFLLCPHLKTVVLKCLTLNNGTMVFMFWKIRSAS